MATKWRPDTCKCEIDVIDWDTARGKTVRTCKDHEGLLDDAHLMVVYKGENFVKNMALGELVKAAPHLFDKDGIPDPSITLAFQPPAKAGAARALTITCPKLTTGEKAALDQATTTKFGAGKVTVK